LINNVNIGNCIFMMQFFYGCTEAISRISLSQKA
jgi:hypothetical protein